MLILRGVSEAQKHELTLERIAHFFKKHEFCETLLRVDSRMTVICDSNFEKKLTAPNKTTVCFSPILCEASRGHGGSLQNHIDLEASRQQNLRDPERDSERESERDSEREILRNVSEGYF